MTMQPFNNSHNEKVLITGAAGFIGSHVADYFCSKNCNVSCLVRETTDLRYIKHLPVNIYYADIRDLKSLEKIFKEIDRVIHLAGHVKDWGTYNDFYDINVTGTLNILKACRSNNIQDIIITGSISSYGEENSNEIKNENYPYNSHYDYFLDRIFPCKMNFYRDTKALCTKEAERYARVNDLNLTILEPVWVYGEKEFNTGFYSYLQTVKSGIPFIPGSKKNKFSVVYARDLARAYYLAFKKKPEGVNRIIIGSHENVRMDDLFSIFCNELGFKKPRNLPKTLVYVPGFILELFYSLFMLKHPPLLSRGRVNMFYDNIEFSSVRANEQLSFSNEYSLQEGIQITAKWYKENHLI